MRIWLATVGEPLPVDGENVRLLRTGQFAQWLAGQGHDVTFWTGTMDHYGRKLRHGTTHVSELQPNYRIVQLEGRLYRKTVSYNRFMNHIDVAREFERVAPQFDKPDIILSSFPTVELCAAVAKFAEANSVPFVVDVRDFWPDIFVEVLPKPLRWLGPLIFSGFERRTCAVLGKAAALSGMTQSALNWALQKAGRAQGDLDFWHAFTYPGEGGPLASLLEMPEPAAIDQRPDKIKFCFFGTHSHRVNLEMFVRSFLELEKRGVPASIMVCGKGAITADLQEMSAGSRAVLFPGWLNTPQIRYVMSIADLGVLPYNLPDFHESLPNKIAEYFSGGLPILSCTDGEVRGLIEEQGCGFWCEPTESAIVDAVTQLVLGRDAINNAGVKASLVFAEMFEANAVFSRVIESFEHIVAAHMSRPPTDIG